MQFIKLDKNQWWRLCRQTMRVYNFRSGYHYITEDDIDKSEIYECKGWHELYLAKHFCPLEVDKWCRDVWISPKGKFYCGDAHDLQAEYLCKVIYGIDDVYYAADFLEGAGWIRATTSLMWKVRFDTWTDKKLTQKQYDALWDWCNLHNMEFPDKVKIL